MAMNQAVKRTLDEVKDERIVGMSFRYLKNLRTSKTANIYGFMEKTKLEIISHM
jgi:hypothetical protein